jgi:cyclopropane fatty-acyl-phospholipid synthase-like methyltransferase
LRLFFEELERQFEVNILDVGPICGENINFLAQRVSKLYVCDLFLRLHRTLRNGESPTTILKHLNYSPRSFDAILLWELMDHCNNEEAGKFVEVCHSMLKPGGIVMVFALEATKISLPVNYFVISPGFQVHPCRQYHLDLPSYNRHNRELLELMTPFMLVKSFIYRNGLREFLFRRLVNS